MNEELTLADREAGFLADMAKLNIKWNIGLGVSTVDLTERMVPSINQNNEIESEEKLPEIKF